jgi:hypothetical protein
VTTFSAETSQNEYLPVGATTVDAVVTITASGTSAASDGARDGSRDGSTAAEVIIIDVSGSMNYPRTKIRAARDATTVAIQAIRDGVHFGVLAGTDTAQQVYPSPGRLAIASPATRADAARAVGKLSAGGGTAMGQWLSAANELFVADDSAIRHAILLTDGQNADEEPDELDRAIDTCMGNFQCDCRGVGADWEVNELSAIAERLIGDVSLIRAPEDMQDDFRDLMERAMGRHISNVSLRIWTPQGAQVAYVKQVVPDVVDLTPKRLTASEQVGDYPTGAWSDEWRDYHLQIAVPARDVNEEMLAARVSLVVDDEVVSEAKVRAIWTEDERLSTRRDLKVAEHKLRIEYADVATQAREARDVGDLATETARLKRAAEIAVELDDAQKLGQVQALAEIDAATGKVTLKDNVDELDVLEFATRSVKTDRTRRPDS